MTITLQARPASNAGLASCPLCRDVIQARELREGACGHCPECETRYHRECFGEFGGCSTLGCSAYRQPLRGAVPHSSAPETCAACWDGEEHDLLSSCPGCRAKLHSHCLDQEGCGTPGCDFEAGTPRGAPRRLPRSIRRARRARAVPTKTREIRARRGTTSALPRRASEGSGQVLRLFAAAIAVVACVVFSLASGNFKALVIALWVGAQFLSDD